MAFGVCVVIYFLAPSHYELTVDKEQLFAPDSATTWREISLVLFEEDCPFVSAPGSFKLADFRLVGRDLFPGMV